jgi:predicted DNA-binding transcriptional regulator AlpA
MPKNKRRNVSCVAANKARQADLLPRVPDISDDEVRPNTRLLSKRQTCERVCLTSVTIWKYIRAGKFPPARAVGGKSMWLENEVEAWIQRLPTRELKPI